MLGENRVQEGEAQGARGARRVVAARRPAPVEQGAPGARGLRRDPDRGLGRARRAPRPAGRRGPARAPGTRCWSRSTSTPTRRRPASRRMRSSRRCRRCSDLPNLEVRGLMTVGPARDRSGRRPRDLHRPARAGGGAALALAGARAGAVDGHVRRLRARDRGGRHDRAGRPRDLRRAAAPPRPGRARARALTAARGGIERGC